MNCPMPEEQSTIPGVVPPRVATNDPEMLEAYHNLSGMITAAETIDNLHLPTMPGVMLAKEAVRAEIHKERGRFFSHLARFVAKAKVGNEYVAAGYRFDRHTNEIVVELKSLVEIDEELAKAAAEIAARKGGR